ncbi:hypothetical protein Tco_0694277, partial [Tanacetum coccineum]
EREFEVADSDMPQGQEENLGNDDVEPKEKVASKPFADKPSKTFDELMSTLIEFSVFIMNGLKINNLTQETLLGPAFRLLKGTRTNYAELEYDFEECYKALSEKLDWENPEGGDYPFDLTKPLPFVMSRNRQKVPVNYFFNNDLKYLQGGISTMTYTTSLTKTKAAQYDLPGIEDMVPNILVPVKVEVMRKHRYGYLKEIVVRRADNDLYRFKEGDFPRLRINDIEDMLLLRVKDLQLGVKSYQKKINVTKPQTTISGIKKRDPYTSYQDPQGFIYVDTLGRNMLMRSDELYKFSNRTLTGLQTSLDDITKNIRMEYLPKRRWSTLEKNRANIMIKVIDKQLKERRLMRSLEKFVGGRHYGTDLRLLQRTICLCHIVFAIIRDIPLDSVVVLRIHVFYQLSYSELVGIEKMAVFSSLRSLKPKCTIKSRAKKHQSDTKVIHNDYGNPSRANIKQAFGRFNTTAGNPVKEILFKSNLPDHRSVLTDLKRRSEAETSYPTRWGGGVLLPLNVF